MVLNLSFREIPVTETEEGDSLNCFCGAEIALLASVISCILRVLRAAQFDPHSLQFNHKILN